MGGQGDTETKDIKIGTKSANKLALPIGPLPGRDLWLVVVSFLVKIRVREDDSFGKVGYIGLVVIKSLSDFVFTYHVILIVYKTYTLSVVAEPLTS